MTENCFAPLPLVSDCELPEYTIYRRTSCSAAQRARPGATCDPAFVLTDYGWLAVQGTGCPFDYCVIDEPKRYRGDLAAARKAPQQATVRELRQQGLTVRTVCSMTGLSEATVKRYQRQAVPTGRQAA